MTRKLRKRKGRGAQLTYAQKWDLMLGWWPNKNTELGMGEMRSFESFDEAREAWFAHRDELYHTGNAGTRCWGWWKFESGLDRAPTNKTDRLLALIERDELSEGEVKQLRSWSGKHWPPEAEAAWLASFPPEATP